MGHQVYGSLAGRGGGASLPSSASRSYDSSAAFPSSRNNGGSSLMESWISRDISSSGAAHSASRYILGESGYSGAANRLSGAPGGGSGNVSSYDFNSSGITHHDQHHKHTSAAMDMFLSREIAAKPYSSGLYNGANTEALYAQKQHFQAPSSIASTSQQQLAPWNSLSVSVTSHVLPAVTGAKRSSEDVSQPILGSHILGQGDALSSANTLNKRPRTESMGDLPIYPQRPGEKDCKYYMITRTCKFGAQCKFDHPLWVPPGGLPDWKEVPSVTNNEPLPERPGEPECTFYMKTGLCKYGGKCKFHHPKDRGEIAQGSEDKSAEQSSEVTACDSLPQRPGEQECSFFIRTGVCKYGAKCKFDHPKGRQGSQNEDHKKINEDSTIVGKPEHQKVREDSAIAGETVDAVTRQKEDNGLPGESVKLEKNEATFKPATVFNSKGLPIRPGETDCAFYMKTGSCKYGELCRYNHPDRKIHVPATVMPVLTPTQSLTAFPGVVNPTQSLTSFQGVVAPSQSLTAFPLLLPGNELGATVLPQRPGQPDCSFYIKNGKCDYGANCKFHHPLDRPDSSVKLTLAGLPRREGATICAFYLKTGVCKYKANCKFDHPPPGEIEAARTQAPVKLTAAGLPRREDEATCEFYMQTGTCKLGVSCKFDHPPPGEAAAKALASTIVTKETDGMIQGRSELEGDGTK